MDDISKNIKKVLIVFLLCFIGVISYITYFEIFTGPKIVNNAYNKRLWVKRNEVLRGTIFDRNNKPLTLSARIDSETQKREYTGGEIFSHVLGYVNIKYGITGLERKYDEALTTTDIQDTVVSFIKSKGRNQEKIGDNLKTTLDYNVQKKAFEMLGNNRGAVVALNPKTGEIIAMVSKPSFNPNNLEESWKGINDNKQRPLLNRATSGLYPPGSTFKTVTAVSALDNMNGLMNRTFEDNGKIIFNGKDSISNFNGEFFGKINFKQSYVHSSNVVFGTLGMELGNEKLKATAEKFYFNTNIPADGIGIENSKFPSVKSYEKGNLAQCGFGQSSVLATPMEMALVVSTIANDGIMMKPMLVKEITTNKNVLVKKIEPEPLSTVTSAHTAKIIKDFMKSVVEEGTGGNAAIDGITVGGKTGTADHQDEGKGALPHSWFIGFAPYDNPRVAVAVIVEDGGQGGMAAARIASEVMRVSIKGN